MSEQAYEQLTLFQGDSPASRSVLPGSDEARRMTVTSGQRCLELYRNSDPLGSLVRMLLGSSIWRSTRCYLTWKLSATPSKRLLFRLVPSTPRIGETDARLWPTVTTQEVEHPEAELTETGRRKTRDGMGSHSVGLADAVKLWPTPKASDYKGSGPAGSKSAEHDRQRGNLKGVVMYPTPTAGAGMRGGTGAYQQLKALEELGQTTEDERRSMAAGKGGQLNPTWVEWLMGFPQGWAEVD